MQAVGGGPRQPDYDLVIVGAGMVGISLALMLARQGHNWRVLIVEARAADGDASAPNFDARSTALSSTTQQIFQQLGVWQGLQRHASALDCIHVSDRGYPGITRITAADAGVDALGYVVENHHLSAQLARQLSEKKIDVQRSSRVSSVTLGPEGVHLSFAEEALPLSAKLLIIADGANSKTAASLGFETAVKDHQQAAIVANVGLGKAHNGVAYERFTALGPMALLPLSAYRGQPRAALVWTQPSERAAATMQLSDADFLAALQDQFGYRTGLFRHVGARASYPLITALVAEQVRSRIALLGNAAHSLHPVAGQGFNLALRDAASLATTMGRARAGGQDFSSIRVLERYRLAQSADQQRGVSADAGIAGDVHAALAGTDCGSQRRLDVDECGSAVAPAFCPLGHGSPAS